MKVELQTKMWTSYEQLQDSTHQFSIVMLVLSIIALLGIFWGSELTTIFSLITIWLINILLLFSYAKWRKNQSSE